MAKIAPDNKTQNSSRERKTAVSRIDDHSRDQYNVKNIIRKKTSEKQTNKSSTGLRYYNFIFPFDLFFSYFCWIWIFRIINFSMFFSSL